MIRVIVADDEYKVCQLICQLINWEELDMRLVGTASNGIEALQMIKAEKPDLASSVAEQLTLFDDPDEIEQREQAEQREKRMQKAVIDIKKRFGPNAILKGTSFQDGATAKERNESIGGHKA